MVAATKMSGPLDILRQLYPQARVTSTRRDPNSALGRANPHSYHNIGQAFDVAPIPGVAFPDYVNSLKSGGVNVVEALDEASHPKAWTTGPNWHVAFGDQSVAPRKPRSLADLGDFAQPSPVGLGAQPMQSPRSLADLQMPQMQQHKPGLFGKGGDGWKILGILGDSYLGANGHEGHYIPQLMRQRENEQTMAFDREKLNAQLDMERQKAMEPPQYVQNAQAWASMGPEQRRQVLQQQDAVNPINVSTPQGTQNVPRTTVKKIGDKTYYSIGGEWYEESE